MEVEAAVLQCPTGVWCAPAALLSKHQWQTHTHTQTSTQAVNQAQAFSYRDHKTNPVCTCTKEHKHRKHLSTEAQPIKKTLMHPLQKSHVHKLGRRQHLPQSVFTAIHNKSWDHTAHTVWNWIHYIFAFSIFHARMPVWFPLGAFSNPHTCCFKPTSKATVQLTTAIWNSDLNNTSNSLVSIRKIDELQWWYSRGVPDAPKSSMQEERHV